MGHSPIGHHSPQPHYHQQHSHLNHHYQQQYHQQQWLSFERLQHDREREALRHQGFGFSTPGYVPLWNALPYASRPASAAQAAPPKPVSPEEQELRDRYSEWSSRHYMVGHPIDAWDWCPYQIPSKLPVTSLHAWLVDSTGRVLVQDVSPYSGSSFYMPGASTDLHELPKHPSVLLQELLEETQVVLADALHLGYKADDCYPDWSTRWFSAEPVARARMVGLISEIRPLPADLDAERLGKRLYRRYLTPIQSAPEDLTHWKYSNSCHNPPSSPDYVAAMAVAAQRWGVPVSAPTASPEYLE